MPMGEGVILQAPSPEESVMTYIEGFLSVYIHVLASGSPDWVVLDFFRRYQATLVQVHRFLWRVLQSMRYFSEKAGIAFTLSHLVRLYRPLRYQGLISLPPRSTWALVIGSEQDEDSGWMNQFIQIQMTDVIPEELFSLYERLNFTRKYFIWTVLSAWGWHRNNTFLLFVYSNSLGS